MPSHASEDAVTSEDMSSGPLTRRRFLTYVVAAPVLTVAASSVGDLIAPSRAYAVVPSPPQPENIADLGGLSVAYDAMQRATEGKPDPRIDGLSRDQRFFLGWATAFRTKFTPEMLKILVSSNPHAPDLVRASAAPTNVPAFATAFNCKAGDPMLHSGEQLVVIW